MSKIAVLADSSCDFTPQMAAEAGFSLVPLTVSFEDGSVYRDGIDLSSSQFFEKLVASKDLPRTSQPSPDVFMDAFRQHADCDDIICITVSSKCSGTINSAANARRMLLDEGFQPRIHLIDSLNASAVGAMMAMTAIRMRDSGEPIETIVSRLVHMRKSAAIYFVLDTVEYVRKGGRIGNITAMVGTLLGIKPMLTFLHGIPINVDKTRGLQQAFSKLVEKFLTTSADLHNVIIVSANSPDRALNMQKMLRRHIADIQCQMVEVGSVMGTYTGPGGVALVFEEKGPRW